MEKFEKAKQIFIKNNGLMHTGQAQKAGIAPKTLYSMVDEGVVTRISRGIYALTGLEPITDPDLVTVALKVPAAVFCLISALNYHNLSEQMPRFVYFSLPQGARKPQINYPPVKIVWSSKDIYQAGIQEVIIDNTQVRIYSPEKTITDCFKFRNKYGLDVAIDALKRYLALPSSKQDFDSLMQFARLNRVEKIITPYIESLQ